MAKAQHMKASCLQHTAGKDGGIMRTQIGRRDAASCQRWVGGVGGQPHSRHGQSLCAFCHRRISGTGMGVTAPEFQMPARYFEYGELEAGLRILYHLCLKGGDLPGNKTFQLLECLMRSLEKNLSTDELIERIWGKQG